MGRAVLDTSGPESLVYSLNERHDRQMTTKFGGIIRMWNVLFQVKDILLSEYLTHLPGALVQFNISSS